MIFLRMFRNWRTSPATSLIVPSPSASETSGRCVLTTTLITLDTLIATNVLDFHFNTFLGACFLCFCFFVPIPQKPDHTNNSNCPKNSPSVHVPHNFNHPDNTVCCVHVLCPCVCVCVCVCVLGAACQAGLWICYVTLYLDT